MAISVRLLRLHVTGQADQSERPRDPTGKTFFANNQVPISLFSAPALKMMTYYPAPQDGCGTSYYGDVANKPRIWV